MNEKLWNSDISEKTVFKKPSDSPWNDKDLWKIKSENLTTPSPEKIYYLRSPDTNGRWTGEKGDSVWIPDRDYRPEYKSKYSRENPDNLTWGEILDKYGIEGIEFKDGYPDFGPISKIDVEIDGFSSDRLKNFAKADEKTAEQWTKEGKDGKVWTAEDVKNWRKENNYTWHECEDCKTMQLVPTEVHNNIPHSGGISEIKKQENSTN
ncbi:HNH endonuclease [Otariodibacter sp.]|uniref:HNH endonuclease n=1 Tax=Otariodibacter sp. TaxID=3030919 RepID=UPI00261FA3E2|nr:HNH endonuclease [Otariodibacter sp.]